MKPQKVRSPPLPSGDEALCPVPAAPGQVHPHAVGGRLPAEPCTGSDEWLLEPLPPTWWEGVWPVAGIPRGFLSGALPSPVPQPLPSLSVPSPPLGCAAVNNSQGPLRSFPQL